MKWWPRERPMVVRLPEEHFVLTSKLRWSRQGVLEQMLRGSQGTEKWEPVPTENGDHIDPEKEKLADTIARRAGFKSEGAR